MYYCKSRFYVPYWRRWLNGDSVEYLDINNVGCINLFAYCNNNPVMFVDYEGNMPRWLKYTLGTIVVIAVSAFAIATHNYALIGLMIGTSISTAITSGLSFDGPNIKFEIDKFANGFLLGSIIGAISTIASYAIHLGKISAELSLKKNLIIAGIDSLLGVTQYMGVNIVNNTIDNISIGGIIISALAGLFDFSNTASVTADFILNPTIAASFGWSFDQIKNNIEKVNNKTEKKYS